jgi:LSD1 subclass zinc finger protein
MGPCKHKWALIDKTVFKSAWEQAHDGGSDLMKTAAYAYTSGPAFPTDESYFRKKAVSILSCKRCGALDKTETVFEIEKPDPKSFKVMCPGCLAPIKVVVGSTKIKCGECGRVTEIGKRAVARHGG